MISIITPFFQSEKYIEASIYSVLQQSFDDWELLLINDGSDDQSKDIALSFKDPRIRYFEQNNSNRFSLQAGYTYQGDSDYLSIKNSLSFFDRKLSLPNYLRMPFHITSFSPVTLFS